MDKAYLLGKIFRYIFGCRVCLGIIKCTFGLDPYQIIGNIDAFLEDVSETAAATMDQATDFGILDDVEIDIDVDGFDDIPLTYDVQNPAGNMGITQKDLAGLTNAEKNALRAAISMEADDICNSEIRRDVVYFLVSKVLA